jgi:hypothetical protein
MRGVINGLFNTSRKLINCFSNFVELQGGKLQSKDAKQFRVSGILIYKMCYFVYDHI